MYIRVAGCRRLRASTISIHYSLMLLENVGMNSGGILKLSRSLVPMSIAKCRSWSFVQERPTEAPITLDKPGSLTFPVFTSSFLEETSSISTN